jgi:hypothetical protein
MTVIQIHLAQMFSETNIKISAIFIRPIVDAANVVFLQNTGTSAIFYHLFAPIQLGQHEGFYQK